jgi:hypothetical protein
MSLADPLPAAYFMDLLQVEDVNFIQMFNQQRSIPGGGDTRVADRTVPLLKAEITTIPVTNSDTEGLMARINSRGGGLKTVLLFNSRLPYPSTDPDGTALSAATPTVRTISDRLHVGFENLPADLVLPYGTWFSTVFDSSRYYLGQLVETATADGAGDTSIVEIWPPLPAAVEAGDEVSFSEPCGKFRINAGSAYPQQSNPLFAKIRFTAEQTYITGDPPLGVLSYTGTTTSQYLPLLII